LPIEATFVRGNIRLEATFVADTGNRIRCKLARRTCTDDAVRIVHVSGDLVPAPARLQMAQHMKPPCRIEGPLFDTAKKIL